MQQPAINPPGLLAAVAGIALITIGFYVLIPVETRDAVAWAGYGVFILVYLANLTNASLARVKPEGFDAQIPRLGILWAAYSSYTILAVGGFFVGVAALLPLRVLLFGELILLVGLIAMVRMAGFASAHVVALADSEEVAAADLNSLRTAASECQSRLTRTGRTASDVYEQFMRVLEGIRYLSPSGQYAATSLESEIKSLLLQATDQVGSAETGEHSPSAKQTLDRCEALLKLRRQQTRG